MQTDKLNLKGQRNAKSMIMNIITINIVVINILCYL